MTESLRNKTIRLKIKFIISVKRYAYACGQSLLPDEMQGSHGILPNYLILCFGPLLALSNHNCFWSMAHRNNPCDYSKRHLNLTQDVFDNDFGCYAYQCLSYCFQVTTPFHASLHLWKRDLNSVRVDFPKGQSNQ